jgi:nitrite reductase (cytochrome c-552)
MAKLSEIVARRPWVGWVIFLATLLVVFLVGLLGATIVERRTEAQLTGVQFQPLPEFEPRNAVWGQQFPRQFQSYIRTLDTTFASKYGGSRHRDMLEQHPEKVILWAGYAFQLDYNQIRGHYYAVKDVHQSLRTTINQPATCWTCKSTDVPRLMNEMGVEEFYADSWHNLGPEVANPIGCQDCHDPTTMQLRITRPALVEALDRKGVDIERVTHQEMRSLVCAQCHVEYYFQPETNYLVFPWDQGIGAEQVEQQLDDVGHIDWTHALSRAPMIKVQHPDYELYTTGIHAYRGVSCADCHMPYRREGGVKFTNHHIQSPLNDVASSCLVCHGGSEQELLDRVYVKQDKVMEMRKTAEDILARLHVEAKAAWDAGATQEEMQPVLQKIRSAQWRWDWIAASHGAAFHAPEESGRLLASSIAIGGEARLVLSRILGRLGVDQPVQMPDLTSKAAAQQFVGLNMERVNEEKVNFLRNILPSWQEEFDRRGRDGPTDYVPSALRNR